MRRPAQPLFRGLLALATFAAIGCGQAPGGRATGGVSAGGKGDDVEEDSSDDGGTDQPMSDHRGATMQCEAVADHLRAHINTARTDSVVDLERDRNDCLVRANDAARPVIDAKLDGATDPFMGQSDRSWRSHRDDAVAACNALVEAHADAGGDALAAVATACISGAELHLALVLDAYVDFGVAPFSIPAARDTYPSCYAALDASLETASGDDPIEEAVAQSELADCIVAEHDALLPELATRVAATFPGKDALVVETELRDALAALHETRDTICSISVHAGPTAGTPNADLDIAECEVDIAIQQGELIASVAPDLLPDDAGSEGGGSESSGSDEGGSSEGSSSDDGAFESSTSY